MASKTVDFIRRTGSATSSIRQIVVVQGVGKKAVQTVLSTPIEKIAFGTAFRHGGKHTPVEQYAFKVGSKIVERFADATALVMKRHNVALSGDLSEHQTYVQDAVAILNGEKTLRVLQELPEGAVPAVVTREPIAA